jgi:hypothetical protein
MKTMLSAGSSAVVDITREPARPAAAPDMSTCGHCDFSVSERSCSNASRLLRSSACQQRNPPRSSDAASNSGLGSTANRRMLRLGPGATAIFIHDRDSRYGASFDRQVRRLGIQQVRTPFTSNQREVVIRG